MTAPAGESNLTRLIGLMGGDLYLVLDHPIRR